ncbi:uncharacterized protein EV420DRAFT_446395 [Desarmillaria tabescens]|uniref:Uncharacterized protein n=1 Tax=Armillaria tabescens TaxID=1929756 RepID=A0AA39TW13_ARMTA|nr:uncharacterized protein EV420DRAFT_446395 [Desarmillaria tabescens]KAK0468088.1 hypothetical protein EV420DRAFT_446395 [Desarmillaria tabescens]
MNENEATLVSETLRWAECGEFSVGLKIQDITGWPTSPRLTFYIAGTCGTIVTRYTIPHDAADPRHDVITHPSVTSLESMERVFKTNLPPDSPGDYFQHKLHKVPPSAGDMGKLEKCYQMLGLPPKLSMNISVFEQLRVQQGEGREYYVEENDEGEFGAVAEDDGASCSSRPSLLEPKEVNDGVLVDGCFIPILISALYGKNPPPSPLSPNDRLLLDVFTIRTHISYAISRLVRYTEHLRGSVKAVEGMT